MFLNTIAISFQIYNIWQQHPRRLNVYIFVHFEQLLLVRGFIGVGDDSNTEYYHHQYKIKRVDEAHLVVKIFVKQYGIYVFFYFF